MRIFLASKFELGSALVPIAERLIEEGNIIVSSWIFNLDKDDQDRTLWSDYAISNSLEIQDCDIFVLYNPNGTINERGSAKTELGYALGLRKHIIIIGNDNSNIYHKLKTNLVLDSFEQLFTLMRGINWLRNAGVDIANLRTSYGAMSAIKQS